MEPQARRSIQQTGRETKQVDSSQLKSEEKTYDFSKNISNMHNIITYEENNSAESQVGKEFYN